MKIYRPEMTLAPSTLSALLKCVMHKNSLKCSKNASKVNYSQILAPNK